MGGGKRGQDRRDMGDSQGPCGYRERACPVMGVIGDAPVELSDTIRDKASPHDRTHNGAELGRRESRYQ
jgi:hypothetical protein